MSKLWIITGPFNSGKSSLAHDIAEKLCADCSLTIGGVVNRGNFTDTEKTGYTCESLLTGETMEFAQRGKQQQHADDFICGQWVIHGSGLAFVHCCVMDAINVNVDLLVIDEFGILEKESKGVYDAIQSALTSPIPVALIVREGLCNLVTDTYAGHDIDILDLVDIKQSKKSIEDLSIYQWFIEHKETDRASHS